MVVSEFARTLCVTQIKTQTGFLRTQENQSITVLRLLHYQRYSLFRHNRASIKLGVSRPAIRE